MGAQNLFFPLLNTEFPLCVNLKSIFNNVFFASHIQVRPFPGCFLALLTLRLKNLSSLTSLVFKSYLLYF